eukprot:1149219-Pelagomonas_calceolata.AAC.1
MAAHVPALIYFNLPPAVPVSWSTKANNFRAAFPVCVTWGQQFYSYFCGLTKCVHMLLALHPAINVAIAAAAAAAAAAVAAIPARAVTSKIVTSNDVGQQDMLDTSVTQAPMEWEWESRLQGIWIDNASLIALF